MSTYSFYLKFSRALMATPLVMKSMDPSSSSSPSSQSILSGEANSAEDGAILIFLYFHKAIRSELDRIHRLAVALATDGSGRVETLTDSCRFLSNIYKHHCKAEDAVWNSSKSFLLWSFCASNRPIFCFCYKGRL